MSPHAHVSVAPTWTFPMGVGHMGPVTRPVLGSMSGQLKDRAPAPRSHPSKAPSKWSQPLPELLQ